MKAFLRKHLDDLFLTSGAILVVLATAMINGIAALYVSGVILTVYGILIGIGNARSGE